MSVMAPPGDLAAGRQQTRGAGRAGHPRLEAEIAVLCARSVLDPADRVQLARLLAHPVDWPLLVRIAVYHGVMPLLCHHLSETCASAVPTAVLGQIRERLRRNAVRNMMLTGELTRITELFEGRGIAAVAFKGPFLGWTAYGSLGLRSFSDLDILVDRAHVSAAGRVLVEQGYRPSSAFTRSQEAAYRKAEYAHSFLHDDQSAWIELHWAITPRYFALGLDPAALMARARPVTMASWTCRTLAPEDLFLVLCVHGTKHCWERIESVASLAELVRRPGTLDWDVVMARAAEWGASRMVRTSLALAHDLVRVTLPDSVRQIVLADPVALRLARESAARLLTGAEGAADRFEQARFHVLARERYRDRLRYMIRLATTQTVGDWRVLSLPYGLRWAYRIIRPIRLALKFGPAALGRVMGRAV